MKCLKNKYEHCGIDPIHESAALSSDLYTQLSALILSVESLITGYYDYMQQCLGKYFIPDYNPVICFTTSSELFVICLHYNKTLSNILNLNMSLYNDSNTEKILPFNVNLK